ncbi:MAG: hypothetical protein ACUVRY_10290 [Thermoanaerobaculaceae bacterium]
MRFFRLQVTPLRERGDDWKDLVAFLLACLENRHGVTRTLTPESWEQLAQRLWPGTVRELLGVITMGYAMAVGTSIRPEHFVELLGEESPCGLRREDEVLRELLVRGDFWRLVQDAFLDRELNRAQVQHIIRSGLAKVGAPTSDFWLPLVCLLRIISGSWAFCVTIG